MKEYVPFLGKTTAREQFDRLFSRKMLGSVLVGKFIGDYTALTFTRVFGTDLGYSLGIVLAVFLFVFWEKVERAADEAKEKVEEEYTE